MPEMWRLIYRLVVWDLKHKRTRLLLMTLAIFGALSTYVLFGAILNDATAQTMQMWRTDSPYDLIVDGAVEDLADVVFGCRGVRWVSTVRIVNVVLGSIDTTVFTPGEKSLFVLDCESGSPPARPDEIAMPSSWAASLGKMVGDSINVLPMRVGAEAKMLRISGLLSSKTGVPEQAVLTPAGIASLDPSAKQRLLVALDGKVSINSAKNDILGLSRNIQVQSATDQYAGVQSGMGIADMLLSSMRSLVLVIAASSMGVLIHLTQREQAYQSGVLRAMGLRRTWLIAAPLTQGLIVFLAGGALSFAAVGLWARSAGLLSGMTTVTSLFFGQAGLFICLGLIMVAVSAISFAYKPITVLLNDIWGK